MKKRMSKKINILLYVTIAMLSVLCVFSGTLAYYTATGNTSGSTSFYDLEVYFAYRLKDSTVSTTVQGSTLTIYPASSSIKRGDKFTFESENGTTIEYLQFTKTSNSCDAYVRFWIDAYADGDTTTTNYGEYFELELTGITRCTTSDYTNVYYYNEKITSTGYYAFASSMTLSASAPNEILGKSLTITILFEAVQADNEAFKTAFNDSKGYYSGWT